MRQKQKNNFSLRLACVGGTLTAENLKKIAEVAEKYGDGYVHLTSRQGVEIPFIKLNDIDDVTADLATGGCKPGVCGPRVRTVTACQGNAVCPSGNINSYDIAVKLNERYFGRELPHKFKFGVTGCQNNCLKAEENDVGIKGAAQVTWQEDACIHCGVCEKACREEAISFKDDKLVIDTDKCNYCGRCAKSCPVDAWDVNEAFRFAWCHVKHHIECVICCDFCDTIIKNSSYRLEGSIITFCEFHSTEIFLEGTVDKSVLIIIVC